MKHYADESKNKSKPQPRHSQKAAAGKRYAATPEKHYRHEKTDRFEKKKPPELRIKKQPSDLGSTKLYPVKKADVIKEEQKAKRARTDCPATPTAPVPQTKAGYAPAILFAGFIVAIAIWFIVSPKGTFSASEKRELAEFPNASAENILSGKFGEEFETYFADHFPGRNLWVGVNAYTNLLEGNNGADGIYRCSNGYLINKPVPTNNQIDTNIENLTDFKQEIGDIPMTAMFAPSTGYVVDDVLPMIHDTYRDDEYFPKIATDLKAGGIGFIDLRSTFKKAYQDGAQLYYKTDHHWTTEGAYNAYVEYCNKMKLKAAPRGSFKVERYKGFYGTTYSSSGFWDNPSDTVEVWNNPKNTEDKITVNISDGKPPYKHSNSMFFYEHDKEVDKYPIFLDGNHAFTEITNDNVKDGTILVIKDSFCHSFAPFLAENYHKVIMVDMRYNSQNIIDMVKVEKPDQVLVLYGIDNFAEDTDLGHLWG